MIVYLGHLWMEFHCSSSSSCRCHTLDLLHWEHFRRVQDNPQQDSCPRRQLALARPLAHLGDRSPLRDPPLPFHLALQALCGGGRGQVEGVRWRVRVEGLAVCRAAGRTVGERRAADVRYGRPVGRADGQGRGEVGGCEGGRLVRTVGGDDQAGCEREVADSHAACAA